MKKIIGLVLVIVLSLSIVTASALVLRQSSTGPEVRSLQTKLKNLGYYKDSVDGKYGDSTWKAVWWYQKDKGLKVDGIAGPQTLGALGLPGGSPLPLGGLKMGDSGSQVTSLQTALAKLGLYKNSIDGKYGDSTWKAVWWFQKNNGLNPTGVADSNTLSHIASKSGVAISSYSGGSLELGDSGSAVVALQTALKNLGFYNGTVDGKYGDSTWKAVWWFQKSKGIPSDGVAGPQTLALLNISSANKTSTLPGGKTLKIGSKGDAVWKVQYALQKAGYYNGAVDGKYGDATWKAVWWFQKDKGLPPDGHVGTSTWDLLVK